MTLTTYACKLLKYIPWDGDALPICGAFKPEPT
jgi:hypothetical protein